MKLENLRNELENKIKELILEVLKDFDMSKYENDIEIEYYYTNIIFIDTNNNFKIRILYLYDNDDVKINWEEYNKINIRLYYEEKEFLDYQSEDAYISRGRGYYKETKFYSAESIVNFINSEPIQIIKTLHENKDLLETKLKNILE